MACHPNITATKWPKQGEYTHRRAKAIFHYGGPELLGTIVRDDAEEPFETIIRLDDGRFVRTTECQYSTSPGAAGRG